MHCFLRVSRFCLLLSTVLFAGPAFAADPIVNTVQKQYASIKTMKSSFTQTLTHKESGGTEQRSGVLYFAKPMQVRWETKNPIPELLLVTDKVIWNAFPDEKVAYKYSPKLAEDSRNIIRVVTGQSSLDKDFVIENKGKEDGLVKLVLIPREPSQSLVEATIWVDEASGLIKRVIIVDFYYNQNDIRFTSQSVGEKFAASVFSYKPPKSMKIEDRTKSGVLKKKLMQ